MRKKDELEINRRKIFFTVFTLSFFLISTQLASAYPLKIVESNCDTAGSVHLSIENRGEYGISMDDTFIQAQEIDSGKTFEINGTWSGEVFDSTDGQFFYDGDYNISIRYLDPKDNQVKKESITVNCPGVIFACSYVDLDIEECFSENNYLYTIFSAKNIKQGLNKRLDLYKDFEYEIKAKGENKLIWYFDSSLPEGFIVEENGIDTYLIKIPLFNYTWESIRIRIKQDICNMGIYPNVYTWEKECFSTSEKSSTQEITEEQIKQDVSEDDITEVTNGITEEQIKQDVSEAVSDNLIGRKVFLADTNNLKYFLWLLLIIPLIFIFVIIKNRIPVKRASKKEELIKEEKSKKISQNIITAINVNNFTVKHGSKIILDNVSFSIKRGDFVSLIGGSGSGKSTIIKALVGRKKQTSGKVKIFEKEVGKDEKIYQYVGFVPQNPELYMNQTVIQNIENSAIRWGVSKSKERINNILNKLGISSMQNQKAKSLSGGQSRLLSLAMELVRDPELLILDEPTTGLDPNTRNQIITILSSLARYEHKTVLITTHFMDDAEECDEVIIIGKKKVIAQGSPEKLEKRLPGSGKIVNIILDNVTDDLLNKINRITDIGQIIREGRALNILTNNPDQIEIANKIRQVGGSIVESKRSKATMKEVFVFFTGKPPEEN